LIFYNYPIGGNLKGIIIFFGKGVGLGWCREREKIDWQEPRKFDWWGGAGRGRKLIGRNLLNSVGADDFYF